jgi:hypothetical protein
MAHLVERHEQTPTPLCHCVAQACWHLPAFLIANEEGLLRLRTAIDLALATKNQSFAAQMFAADGEGYHLIVRHVSSHAMNDQAMGYTDPIANVRPEWPDWMFEDIIWTAGSVASGVPRDNKANPEPILNASSG